MLGLGRDGATNSSQATDDLRAFGRAGAHAGAVFAPHAAALAGDGNVDSSNPQQLHERWRRVVEQGDYGDRYARSLRSDLSEAVRLSRMSPADRLALGRWIEPRPMGEYRRKCCGLTYPGSRAGAAARWTSCSKIASVRRGRSFIHRRSRNQTNTFQRGFTFVRIRGMVYASVDARWHKLIPVYDAPNSENPAWAPLPPRWFARPSSRCHRGLADARKRRRTGGFLLREWSHLAAVEDAERWQVRSGPSGQDASRRVARTFSPVAKGTPPGIGFADLADGPRSHPAAGGGVCRRWRSSRSDKKLSGEIDAYGGCSKHRVGLLDASAGAQAPSGAMLAALKAVG